MKMAVRCSATRVSSEKMLAAVDLITCTPTITWAMTREHTVRIVNKRAVRVLTGQARVHVSTSARVRAATCFGTQHGQRTTVNRTIQQRTITTINEHATTRHETARSAAAPCVLRRRAGTV